MQNHHEKPVTRQAGGGFRGLVIIALLSGLLVVAALFASGFWKFDAGSKPLSEVKSGMADVQNHLS